PGHATSSATSGTATRHGRRRLRLGARPGARGRGRRSAVPALRLPCAAARRYCTKAAPCMPRLQWDSQNHPKVPALASVKLAVVPVLVVVKGLVASVVQLVPPLSGWFEKSPWKVSFVPVFTLMHGGLYASVLPTGKVIVTVLSMV